MRPILPRDPLADPEELIRRVYAYAAYRLGDGPDAEDVTSEVFERALRYRKSYDRSKGEPVSWLLGIAHRCADDALAARSADRSADRLEFADAVHDRSVEEDSIRRLSLSTALARLTDRERELVALRFGADLTAAQIARIVDARTNAVEVALHRALAKLRSILEDDEVEDVLRTEQASEEAAARVAGGL